MIKISKMTGKLEGIPAINTDTTSNEFCIKMSATPNTICAECYSWNMLSTFRKNCVPAFKHNSEMLSGRMLEDWEIPRTPKGIYRIHAHGEFINAVHFDNVMRIISDNPQTFFGVWTKRKDLVRWWLNFNEKPSNCNYIYSNVKVDSPIDVPEGFDKVFSVYSEGGDQINCHSKCKDCRLCYEKNDVQFINEVIK